MCQDFEFSVLLYVRVASLFHIKQVVLELMISPHYQLGGAVVAPPSRLGWSQVRTLVWPYFSLPTSWT
jgi:hypothetical protein